jgi:large subunit ribosomal protein L4
MAERVKTKTSLPGEIFSQPFNEHVVHSALVWYMASKRRGTHSAKTMGEVAGSGKKPWRQKGTGRARAGKLRSPLWRGGGVIFPPKPREHSNKLPKKVRNLALKVALSQRARENRVKLVDDIKVASPKTKEMVKFLDANKVEGKSLIVSSNPDKNLTLSARNINGVKLISANELNIHDLLGNDWVVLTKEAVSKLEERLK